MRRALRGSRLRGNDGSFRLPLPPITLILIPSNTLILIPSNTLILIPSNTLILIPSNTLILIPSNTLILIPSNTLILTFSPQGRRDLTAPHPPSASPRSPSSSPSPLKGEGIWGSVASGPVDLVEEGFAREEAGYVGLQQVDAERGSEVHVA